jgi:hypothetical protein
MKKIFKIERSVSGIIALNISGNNITLVLNEFNKRRVSVS